jgi:hypothetical protein
MSAHAELGPSGASIWMNCAGSVNAQRGLPDETSEFAAEGTFAHLISEECLAFGLDPYDFIGHRLEVDGFKFEWTEDNANDLAFGIAQVRSFGGEFYGEQQVDLSEWLGPGQFGTLDRAIKLPGLIIIDDLKFGRGIPVSPIENKQLMLYGVAFWRQYCRESHPDPATDVLIIIDQPRCSGGGGEWRTTVGRLLEFAEEARQAAERTRDPNAPRTAGDHCTFCRRRSVKGGCPTFDEFAIDLVDMVFGDVDGNILIGCAPELPAVMTPERRAYILQHRKLFEDWLDILHDQALDDATRGLPCGGLKAVDGRKSPDKWFDNDRADAALLPILGDARLTKKVKTPTQITKELGDLVKLLGLEALINRGSKKPVLVSEQDARPAVRTLEQMFDEVETEEV